MYKLAFKKYNGSFRTPYFPGSTSFIYTASVKCITAPKIENRNIKPGLPTIPYSVFPGTKKLLHCIPTTKRKTA